MITRINANTNTHARTNFKANLTEEARKLLLKNADKVEIAKVQEFLADEATKHLTVHAMPFQKGYIMAARSEKYPIAKDHLLKEDKALAGFVVDKNLRTEQYYPEQHPGTINSRYFDYSDSSAPLELDKKDPDILEGFIFHEGQSTGDRKFIEGRNVSSIKVTRKVPVVFSSDDFMSNMLDLEKVQKFETEVIAPNHNKVAANIAESAKINESLGVFYSGLNYRSDNHRFEGIDYLKNIVNDSAQKGELTAEHRAQLYALRDGIDNTTKIKFQFNIEPDMGMESTTDVHVFSDKYPKAGYQMIKRQSAKKGIDELLEGLEPSEINRFVNENLKKTHNKNALAEIFEASRS